MTTFWSAIVNSTILSTLLSLAVWLALQITPRHALNAATRYAIWWLVLIATLALPMAYIRLTPTRLRQQAALTNPTRDVLWVQSTPTAPVATRAITLPLEIPASKWLQPLLLFWIATSLLLLARVILSYAALYRRSARATSAPHELSGRLDTWLAHSGSARKGARLAISHEIEIPVATGPFRTAVLIPAKLFEAMTDTDLEQIGRHEAAHLARRDDCTLFVQRIVEALFALHPVVRWLTRQIDLEREIACDDRAAGGPEQARSYADCLTRTVALCGGVRTSLAAANVADGRSHLSRRVELLLKNGRTAQVSLRKGRCAVIAVALIGVATLLAKTPLLLAFSTPAPPPPRILAQAAPPPFIEQPTAGTKDDRAKGELYLQLGQTYRAKNDYPAAINALEQAAVLLPDNASVFANLGVLYDAQGNVPQARRNYERAIAIDPNNPLVLNNLAYALTETNGDLDLALTYARTAQQKLPNFNEVNDTIGWIYLKKGLISDAVGAFKILTDAQPAVAEFHYHYALALSRQGSTQDAFDECRLALERHPTSDLEAKILALSETMVKPVTGTNEPPLKPLQAVPSLKYVPPDRTPFLQDVDPLPPESPGLNRLPTK